MGALGSHNKTVAEYFRLFGDSFVDNQNRNTAKPVDSGTIYFETPLSPAPEHVARHDYRKLS